MERDNAGEEVKVRFVNFNSQAHVERDQGMERRIIMTKISTHTLTWSVTRSSAGRPDRTEYFNSHAHVERDRLVRSARLCKIISTHTLTWSVTYRYFQGFPSLPYFNSHAHVERDFNSRSNSLVLHISTHTLTWSVTGGSAPPQSFRPISTHTLTWSVTDIAKIFEEIELFQLTRSRGA